MSPNYLGYQGLHSKQANKKTAWSDIAYNDTHIWFTNIVIEDAASTLHKLSDYKVAVTRFGERYSSPVEKLLNRKKNVQSAGGNLQFRRQL